jgi:hypothetical protein
MITDICIRLLGALLNHKGSPALVVLAASQSYANICGPHSRDKFNVFARWGSTMIRTMKIREKYRLMSQQYLCQAHPQKLEEHTCNNLRHTHSPSEG